ncbi:MAG: BA14K family protein [Pseudomonadota bacterium]
MRTSPRLPIWSRLGAAAALMVLATASFTVAANAHDTRYRHVHHGTDAAIAAGVAGLIIGGIIANSNSRQRIVTYDHCHGRYCHRHHHNTRHYHHHSGAVVYKRPQRVKRVQRVVRAGLPHAHYRWCDARYRSYRISDNSFQPYHGHRRQCVSPYY